MKGMRKLPIAACLMAALTLAVAVPARAQKALDRLNTAAQTFHEIMTAPDGGVPKVILRNSQCIMIVPGLKKAGVIVGGEAGRGVVSCRLPGGGWSAPLFITIGGGSFGLQLGAEENDLVMLIMNRDGETYLLKDKFTLGGDMAATAGPVGRDATADTDAEMHAKMLAYSRSRGLFGGITLNGAVIKQDSDSNKWLYKNATAADILNGKTPRPPEAAKLLSELSTRAGN